VIFWEFIGEFSRISGHPASMGVFIVFSEICIIIPRLYTCIGEFIMDKCIVWYVYLYLCYRPCTEICMWPSA